jgi:hypothetical protein
MRPTIELEQFQWSIGPVFDDEVDAFGIDQVEVQGVFDRLGQLRQPDGKRRAARRLA